MMLEDLEAWQQARHLVNEIYSVTRENSSLSKDFGLTNQVQRAAVSIMSNVAEGFERKTPKDFAHFLDLAKGSCGEVRSMLYVAEDLIYLAPADALSLRDRAEKLSRGIASFTGDLRS
jgi:four helix bundle protein